MKLRPTYKRMAIGVLIAVAALVAWHLVQRQLALQGIPSVIRTSGILLSDSSFGLRESCGAHIHQISDESLSGIQSGGLKFFDAATRGRDDGKYFNYTAWKSTPAPAEIRVLRGLVKGCISMDDPKTRMMVDAIGRAADSHGAYYSIGYEYDIVVIPEYKVVVVSFDG